MVLVLMSMGIQMCLMVGIVLVVSLFVLVVGWYWIFYEEDELMQVLCQCEVCMVGFVECGFVGLIWNFDYVVVDNLFDVVMVDQEVYVIEFWGLGLCGGVVWCECVQLVNGLLWQEFIISYQFVVDVLGMQVVLVVLIFMCDFVDEQICCICFFVVELLVVVVVGIVIVSLLLVYWLVCCLVVCFGVLVQCVVKGDFGVQEKVECVDEIGELMMCFNVMSLKLCSVVDQVQFSFEGLCVSEVCYCSLFENVIEGIFQVDVQGCVLGMNCVFMQMLGLGL